MNLIHRQILDLNIDSQLPHQSVMEKMRSLFWEALLPRIDHIFSELCPGNQVYRFDQLEIDLGDLSVNTLDENLLFKVDRHLRKTIKESLRQIQFDTHFTGVKVEMSSGKRSKVQAFLHFLQTGVRPWWSGFEQKESLEELFRLVVDKEADKLIDFLKGEASSKIIQRFVQQFSVPAIIYFAQKVIPSSISLLKQLRTELESLAQLNSPGNPSIQSAFLHHFKKLTLKAILQRKILDKSQVNDLLENYFKSDAEGQNLYKIIFPIVTRSEEKTISTGLAHTSSEDDLIGSYVRQQMKVNSREKKYSQTGLKQEPANGIPPSDSVHDQEKANQKNKSILQQTIKEGIHLNNAGLVLIAPFFPTLFEELGLSKNNTFQSASDQERAVLLSQYLATGEVQFEEPDLLLNKILLGWPIDEPLFSQLTPRGEEKKQSIELLESVIDHWKAIGAVSMDGFRNSFIRRQGKLYSKEEQFHLLVERKGFDVLLEKLPWNISLIKLVWMEQPIWVEW